MGESSIHHVCVAQWAKTVRVYYGGTGSGDVQAKQRKQDYEHHEAGRIY